MFAGLLGRWGHVMALGHRRKNKYVDLRLTRTITRKKAPVHGIINTNPGAFQYTGVFGDDDYPCGQAIICV